MTHNGFFKHAFGPIFWLGLLLAVAFWMGDSLLDAMVLNGGSWSADLLPASPKEIWMRIAVCALLMALGTLGQLYNAHKTHAVEQMRLAQRLFEHDADAIVITNAGRHVVTVNSTFETVTGYSAGEVLGEFPTMLVSHQNDPTYYAQVWREVDELGEWQGEVQTRRRNGMTYPSWLTITALRDGKGRVTNYVATFRDTSAIKRAEQRLQHMAHHDPLTGLPNRALLHDRLQQAMSHARRHKQLVAVVLLDLDQFKEVNDSLGHDIGDQLLQAAALRLRGCVREQDTIARLGGDEFVLVLEELANQETVVDVVSKLRRAMALPYNVANQELVITASTGISLFPQDGRDIRELLKNADAAMYFAKSQGRNAFQFYSSHINAISQARLRLSADLHRAVEHSEFHLTYQPQYTLPEHELRGVEVLLRWNHPEHGAVSPTSFIPLADKTGVIEELGRWVLRETLRQYRTWQDLGCAPVRVSVNISPRQIRQVGLEDYIYQLLVNSNIDPKHLELELTETALLEANQRVLDFMTKLDSVGVKFALDDFGTGYSSLTHLRTFPLSTVKVDRSFVRHLPTNSGDAAIVSAVVSLANNLGMQVVAEGVETEAHARTLERLGCRSAQGYYLGVPISGEDLTRRLRQQAQASVALH